MNCELYFYGAGGRLMVNQWAILSDTKPPDRTRLLDAKHVDYMCMQLKCSRHYSFPASNVAHLASFFI